MKGFLKQIGENLKQLFVGDKQLQQSTTGGFWDKFRQVGNIANSWINKETGAGVTGAEQAMMNYQTSERAASQDFEERMSNTAYQRQVADMQAAGLNPALMYGSGSSGASTPSSSGQSAPGFSPSTMSDLVQLATLKPTLKNMYADAENKKADAALKKQETELKKKMTDYQNLVNSRYNDITDANLSAIKKGLEVSDADIDLKRSDKAFRDVQTAIEEWKKSHQDAYFELEKDLKNSEIDINRVEKAMMNIEKTFMDKYKMKMGTNEQMALVIGLCSMFGIDLSEKCQQFAAATKSALEKVGDAMATEKGDFFAD